MPTDPILIPKVGGESTLAGCCSTQVAPSYQHSLALGPGCKQSRRRDRTSAQKQEQPTFPKPHLLLCWHSGLQAGETPRGSRRPGASTQPFLVLGSARCPLHQTTAGLATGCLLPFFFSGWFLWAAPPESLPTGRARVPWADSPRARRAQPRERRQAPAPRHRERRIHGAQRPKDLLPAPS